MVGRTHHLPRTDKHPALSPGTEDVRSYHRLLIRNTREVYTFTDVFIGESRGEICKSNLMKKIPGKVNSEDRSEERCLTFSETKLDNEAIPVSTVSWDSVFIPYSRG